MYNYVRLNLVDGW